MSVLVHYHPRDLTRDKYDEVNRRMEGSGAWPPDGLELHMLFGSEGSLDVSEIWDSEEQYRAFGEHLRPMLDEVGVEDDPELFEVHELEKR